MRKPFFLSIGIRTESFACVTYLMMWISLFCPWKNFSKNSRCKFPLPFTTYYGLIHSIPSCWRGELKTTNPTNTEDNSKVCSNKNFATKSAYAAILDYFFQAPTAESKILRYGFSKECLKKVYLMPFKATHEVKLQEFQCKIIHSILPSRCSLLRAKLSECDTCRVCDAASETLPHLFQCPIVCFLASFPELVA